MPLQVWARPETDEDGSEVAIDCPADGVVMHLLELAASTLTFPQAGQVRASALRAINAAGETLGNRVPLSSLDPTKVVLLRLKPEAGAAPAPAHAGSVPEASPVAASPALPRPDLTPPATGGDLVPARSGGGTAEDHPHPPQLQAEVLQFCLYNSLDETTMRALQIASTQTVQEVLALGNPVDANARNPCAMVMGRLRKIEPDVGLRVRGAAPVIGYGGGGAAAPYAGGPPAFGGGGAYGKGGGGAPPRSFSGGSLVATSAGPYDIAAFVMRNGLDQRTEGALRALDPEGLRTVMDGGDPVSLPNCRNPSAIVMGRIRKYDPEVGLDPNVRALAAGPPAGGAPWAGKGGGGDSWGGSWGKGGGGGGGGGWGGGFPTPGGGWGPSPGSGGWSPPPGAAAGGWNRGGPLTPEPGDYEAFAARNGLDARTLEALSLLASVDPSKLNHVMSRGEPSEMPNCRNPDAVIMGRIRAVAPDIGLRLTSSGHTAGQKRPRTDEW
eukprot:TRINITY_DN6742_c0_g1_i1.p1 TRINITY_DN6742_c0_g1~~TRINITY_DN6742_c0_g1_i1.p1  ORF type:complete len:525 (+),score=112.87 TRINITY_DN6742_c0_g1_i1:90-1577(+)